MFRNLRRIKQLLPEEEVRGILEKNTNGVLAVTGDEGYPYAVPVSYVYQDGKIYIHSAKAGHKIDAIQKDSKVSFTVIDEDKISPEEFTTYFRSVIAFGRAYVVEEEEERQKAFWGLIEKYSREVPEEKKKEEIDTAGGRALIIGVEIEHITGKEAIELVRMRSKD